MKAAISQITLFNFQFAQKLIGRLVRSELLEIHNSWLSMKQLHGVVMGALCVRV